MFLNPHIFLSDSEIFTLFFNLYLFYGPLWFIIITIVFIIIQFFAEKKYNIGILSPPTLTYFLSFTILNISIIFYSNYEYYYDFFKAETRTKLVTVLLINLFLVITGIIFVFFKKINKSWVQLIFILLLLINMTNAYTSIISLDRTEDKSEMKFHSHLETTPRKIRIVIMDGLSLKFISSYSSDQNLLNFNLMLKNGVRGRIRGFKPNFNMSLINSAMTGLRPYNFRYHSDFKYRFRELSWEFDMFPKYIFFRNSSVLNSTTFYKKKENSNYIDKLSLYYSNSGKKAVKIFAPKYFPTYSEKSLRYNSHFIKLFSDIITNDPGNDGKLDILKRNFFFDDYLRNHIPDLKDRETYYSIVKLPGLGIISKIFYQYSMPHFFGDIKNEDIKKYGRIIEQYYEYYDSILGTLISSTGEDELLVIMSFFEYEPLPAWRRLLVNLLSQDERESFVYSPNSMGTLLMYERRNIKKDYNLKDISINDIFPTFLYYSGYQLSMDLQGEVMKEIFTDEFKLNNPIEIIAD
ncbi:MAG: hypothetical protein ABFR36_08210 [Acidobacteriota bacterium]